MTPDVLAPADPTGRPRGPVDAPARDGTAWLRQARAAARDGRLAEAARCLREAVDAGDDFPVWHAGAALLPALGDVETPRRTARLAVLGSYTTAHLLPVLRLAAWRLGIRLETWEAPYAQHRQAILDPSSPLWAFAPEVVLLAVHAGALELPGYSAAPGEAVEAEVARWTGLWEAVARRAGARVIQHTFVPPEAAPMGHLGVRLPGSRHAMVRAVNARLGERAGTAAALVDCERLAALVGTSRWFEPRYWYASKHAVALGAVPLLARHTAAVLAAELGLGRKCVVLDLDNTLWGGVIGEDGLAGIALGEGPAGEAYADFQEYLLALKARGIILAVCSKNDEAAAREPFEKHPGMRIRLDDVAAFVANWEPKPDNLRRIARQLDLGLDALVFVDDNPVECEAVRRFVPEVDVVALPPDPADYVRAMSRYLLLEASAFTAEDAARTEQYRARAAVAALEERTGSLDGFLRSLAMRAVVRPFDEARLPRIAQLIGKTNQFNVTTRRHGVAQLRAFMADPRCVHLALRLRDRFADHGLVAVLIARAEGERLDIDTWLMSCRVIGRTAEAAMLSELCAAAARRGCRVLRGTYVPTAKNGMVADVFERHGFVRTGAEQGTTTWEYDLGALGPVENRYIEVGGEESEA
jgi:FkbH-like protein